MRPGLLLLGLLLGVLGQLRQQIRTDECPITIANKGFYILQVDYPKFKSRSDFDTETGSEWLYYGQNGTYVSVGTNPFFRRSLRLGAVWGRRVVCAVPDSGAEVCGRGVEMECRGTTLIGFNCIYLNWPLGACLEQ